MNMNSLEYDHEEYRKLLPLKKYKDTIKTCDKNSRKYFISISFNNKADVFSRSFSNNILNVFPKSEFHIDIREFPGNDSPSYMIYNRGISAFIQFRLASKSMEDFLNEVINDYGALIEIEAVHSFEKGQGAMLVEKLKAFSDKVHVPIFLYDTNLKSKNYYQNLDFSNTNQYGNNDEPLLLYKPKENI
ncbi:hypothetical protein [Staphylococcus aureus]|uniref:hypothetical protein n=1 Tax=Staphylococcus aureus TaxID=1280 RepID=UPI0018EADA00|nr:hypothetical protein [Staphylococcus aureus]MBJ6239733.1 hypothetical protein [Staphylococcus aureus]